MGQKIIPTVALLLFLLALAHRPALGIPRPVARQGATVESESFLVITNTSVPCVQMDPMLAGLGQTSPYHLTNEDKLQLLKHYGGGLVQGMQAVDLNTARAEFRNLLPLSMADMSVLERYKKSTGLENLSLAHAVHANAEKFYKVKEAQPSSHEQKAGSTQEETLSVSVANITEPENEPETDPNPNSAREDGTEYLLAEYCLLRGASMGGFDHDLLRLCTVCAFTRIMSPDYWPRYINEAKCSPEDPGCLVGVYEGRPPEVHGRCSEILLTLNILRRQPGMCIMALADGQNVIAEDWEIVSEPVPVGCQCNVKKDSVFARYA